MFPAVAEQYPWPCPEVPHEAVVVCRLPLVVAVCRRQVLPAVVVAVCRRPNDQTVI